MITLSSLQQILEEQIIDKRGKAMTYANFHFLGKTELRLIIRVVEDYWLTYEFYPLVVESLF